MEMKQNNPQISNIAYVERERERYSINMCIKMQIQKFTAGQFDLTIQHIISIFHQLPIHLLSIAFG